MTCRKKTNDSVVNCFRFDDLTLTDFIARWADTIHFTFSSIFKLLWKRLGNLLMKVVTCFEPMDTASSTFTQGMQLILPDATFTSSFGCDPFLCPKDRCIPLISSAVLFEFVLASLLCVFHPAFRLGIPLTYHEDHEEVSSRNGDCTPMFWPT